MTPIFYFAFQIHILLLRIIKTGSAQTTENNAVRIFLSTII